jgi:hypothetical protein
MIPLREISYDFEVGIDTPLKYKVSLKRLNQQWIIRVVTHFSAAQAIGKSRTQMIDL